MKKELTKKRLEIMKFDPMETKDAISHINCAFVWKDSCEGQDFWSGIVDKLRAYIQKNNEKP